jgi:hypothetical protein
MRTFLMCGAFAALFVWLGQGLVENAQATYAARHEMSLEKPLEVIVTKVTPRVVAELPQLPDPRVKPAAISDGKFDTLSANWRRGVKLLVRTSLCDAYDRILWNAVDKNSRRFWLAKAQMIVESSCQSWRIGHKTDFGLFQVQKRACKEVGITGDLLDPKTNVACAAAYRQKLCWSYGHCGPADMFVGYNAGPTGAERIDDKQAFEYARKIDFAFRVLAHSS